MKLVDYSLFGDDKEYCDITFEDNLERKVVISVKENGKHTVECEDVEVDELLEVLEMVKQGKIVIPLTEVQG